ncbi:hypothetical protein NDU88_002088 [Pleurodeles waltl]|uniref:Uncharacterized protein n=1 Tax=Pleurodeles waltl TaxID=8319 RepID=A0AAV7PEC5_PLEWA|nr:hypothetical protein NDU88_002088 [Pleurodeles waltl]
MNCEETPSLPEMSMRIGFFRSPPVHHRKHLEKGRNNHCDLREETRLRTTTITNDFPFQKGQSEQNGQKNPIGCRENIQWGTRRKREHESNERRHWNKPIRAFQMGTHSTLVPMRKEAAHLSAAAVMGRQKEMPIMKEKKKRSEPRSEPTPPVNTPEPTTTQESCG